MIGSAALRSAWEDRSRCVLRFDEVGEADRVGGKARSLAVLSAADFPVPRWVVLTPDAFMLSLTPVQRRALARTTDREELLTLLSGVRLRSDLESVLLRELLGLSGTGGRFAVRSSADDEDAAGHSFAGQLDSFLSVPLRDVASRVADVWRSGFSTRVLAYRREHHMSGLPPAPAVLVQPMVEADVSGVAFSADPVTGNREIAVIASLYGLGTALVSGGFDADTHRVDSRGRIVSRSMAEKPLAHRVSPLAGGGVSEVPVPIEARTRWALSDEQVTEVAALARRAERLFGVPQDIEWALSAGSLQLLQSRPITSLPTGVDDGDTPTIWDNSNIAESYAGVTTPLTYSFARFAYEGVYRQLCVIFGLPRDRVEASRSALETMIGLIRGRVYYNVCNWYRLLAQCPGYRANRAFFEQMIGLRESIPDDVIGRDRDRSRRARLVDALLAVRTSLRIAASYFVLARKIRTFHRRVDVALDDSRDLGTLSAGSLVEAYRTLVRRLLTRWDAPLINDFFAMIFYGQLRRCCTGWCGDGAGSLQNDLLCAAGGMVSTEPERRLLEMAELVAGDEDLVDLLCHAGLAAIRARLPQHEALQRMVDAYLRKFGERCSEELKLETATLHDDPLVLFRAVGSLARHGHRLPRPAGETHDPRSSAEAHVRRALAFRPLRRLAFEWILRNARATIRNRENLRLERTRVFGRVRSIFLALGHRLSETGALEDPRDVLFLEVSEVLGYVEGTAVTTDLKGLVALRRAEYAGYAAEPPPPDRFETRGIVSRSPRAVVEDPAAPEPAAGDTRTGIGCCPGRVAGRVRVVADPRTATVVHGDVLVAERTDPGWILLLPFAAGLLVERGNLLSHSAIVARELGIPTIVAIDGVTRWLRDGDAVEFDGATGVVRRTSAQGADR